jgi:hypothetical protein
MTFRYVTPCTFITTKILKEPACLHLLDRRHFSAVKIEALISSETSVQSTNYRSLELPVTIELGLFFFFLPFRCCSVSAVPQTNGRAHISHTLRTQVSLIGLHNPFYVVRVCSMRINVAGTARLTVHSGTANLHPAECVTGLVWYFTTLLVTTVYSVVS